MKPFKGTLKDWHIFFPAPQWEPEGLGYIIKGTFVDHEDFAGEEGSTSWVVVHNEDTGDIETLNSRYVLFGEAKREPQRYGER